MNAAFNCCTNGQAPDLSQFTEFGFWGFAREETPDGGTVPCEVAPGEDPSVFSIYGLLPDGDRIWIEDQDRYEDAVARLAEIRASAAALGTPLPTT